MSREWVQGPFIKQWNTQGMFGLQITDAKISHFDDSRTWPYPIRSTNLHSWGIMNNNRIWICYAQIRSQTVKITAYRFFSLRRTLFKWHRGFSKFPKSLAGTFAKSLAGTKCALLGPVLFVSILGIFWHCAISMSLGFLKFCMLLLEFANFAHVELSFLPQETHKIQNFKTPSRFYKFGPREFRKLTKRTGH